MSDWQEGEIYANGIRIHYHRTGGDKPAVVLAHGFTDNGLCWTRVARVLQSDYDVVMYDARNHGESDRKQVGDSDSEADCAGVIRELGLENPALIGHSMGARTVARVAGRHPENVRCAILEDPPWPVDLEEDYQERDARFAEFRRWISGLKDVSVEQIVKHGRRFNPTWHDDEFPAWAASKQQVEMGIAPDLGGTWQNDAAAIAVPTLLVYADPQAGGIVSAAAAQQAESLNARIRAQHIPGAGHNIRREQFEPFMTVVQDFLKQQIPS